MQEIVIAGLGNPGAKYSNTLHNIGFKVVERLAERNGWPWKFDAHFDAEVAQGRSQGSSKNLIFRLLKPQTFMNLSGEAIKKYLDYYRLSAQELLVIADDADLPLGTMRLRPSGGPGGHNGLKSIEQCLRSAAYKRLRIGIGRSPILSVELADYVLAPQSQVFWDQLEGVIGHSAELLEKLADEKFEAVMKTANS